MDMEDQERRLRSRLLGQLFLARGTVRHIKVMLEELGGVYVESSGEENDEEPGEEMEEHADAPAEDASCAHCGQSRAPWDPEHCPYCIDGVEEYAAESSDALRRYKGNGKGKGKLTNKGTHKCKGGKSGKGHLTNEKGKHKGISKDKGKGSRTPLPAGQIGVQRPPRTSYSES